MNFEEAYPILRLFIEKADKLEKSSFLNSIKQEFRLDFKIEVNKPMQITSIRPQQESIDAFVLTFRFFLQNNDSISIKNTQKIFDSYLVTDEERIKFNSIRSRLKEFLSDSANLVYKEDNLTNDDILQTILYGELSHANKEKKKKFDLWMTASEIFIEAIWHKFIIAVLFTVQNINCIRSLLIEIIKRHTRQSCGVYIITNYGKVEYFYNPNNY